MQLLSARRLEARVSWAVADVHRPFQTVRGHDKSERVALEILADLERRGDRQALAAALVVAGDAGRARTALEKLEDNPNTFSDWAAWALLENRSDEALNWAQRALDAAPQHSRALWNHALAAEQLGFWLVAAEDFASVARQEEPGWSGEAKQRHRVAQAKWFTIQGAYRDAMQAGVFLALEHRPMEIARIDAAPSLAQLHLHFALRTAPRPEQVRALLPVAAELDRRLGRDAHLVEAVEKAARQNFNVRKRLTPLLKAMIARYFRGLAKDGVPLDVSASLPNLDDAQQTRLLRELEVNGAAEDWALALPVLSLWPQDQRRYEKMAEATADPWYQLGAQNARAAHSVVAGGFAEAEQLLREVIVRADQVAPLRATRAREYLTHIYLQTHRVQEAQTLALAALAKTRIDLDLILEGRFLALLADAARFRYAGGLSLAALTEQARRFPSDCESQRYLHESAAHRRLDFLDPAGIRAELVAATKCGGSLSVGGMFALAELIRLENRADDRRLFPELLRKLREQVRGPEVHAWATHIEGRVVIDEDPIGGEKLLRTSIELANALPQKPTGKTIASYGYGILRTQAGKEGNFDRVLKLTEEQSGATKDQRCVLVVEVQDNRVTVAGRDGQGIVSGGFTRVPLTRPHPQWTEAQEIAEVARPVASNMQSTCEDTPLQVHAGFPLNGHGGWLPDDIAWSYASGRVVPQTGEGAHLVISDVEPPPELGLPRLSSRFALGSAIAIKGAEATIDRVLKASETASLIEFETHGLMSASSEDASMLILSPSAQGYALTASKVRTAKLARHPVILLGACHAATVAPFFRERWSLPHAFLEAGARAVIAAPVDLPDGEARTFFSLLSEAIRKGTNPALALRNERIRWLKQGGSGWVRSVLVFE